VLGLHLDDPKVENAVGVERRMGGGYEAVQLDSQGWFSSAARSGRIRMGNTRTIHPTAAVLPYGLRRYYSFFTVLNIDTSGVRTPGRTSPLGITHDLPH
jgi:hypothetical protein